MNKIRIEKVRNNQIIRHTKVGYHFIDQNTRRLNIFYNTLFDNNGNIMAIILRYEPQRGLYLLQVYEKYFLNFTFLT